MKMYVVHDSDGRIIAAVQEPETESDDYLPARPFPVSPDHRAAEVEVPEEQRELDLPDICTRFRVEAETSRLVPRDDSGA